MKKIFFVVMMLFISLCKVEASEVNKVDAEKLFTTLACIYCHGYSEDVIGPSLRTIAIKYKDKKEELIRFFDGEGKPIVWPDKFFIMEPNIQKLKKLSEEEKDALADFILKQ